MRTTHYDPNSVLIVKVSLYRTDYYCSSGVLTIEVSLYRTVYCGPNGVLIIEASLYGWLTVVSILSFSWNCLPSAAKLSCTDLGTFNTMVKQLFTSSRVFC